MENNIKTPLGELTYLGDLLSTAYPTTVLYHNDKNEPIIVEWLDEVLELDLYVMYKSTVEALEQFIKGIISHLELIKVADKSQYFQFYDSIFNGDFQKIKFNKIDKTSLPKETVYFNEKLSSDYLLIADFFNIEFQSDATKNEYFKVLEAFSEKSNTGLLRLHLNEGENVAYGTVDTNVLGRLLIGFEDLYHETAIDVIRGNDRKPLTKRLPEDISIIEMSSTEVYIQEAASFSIYLKSKTDAQSESKEYEYVSDEIFSNINELICLASNKKKLESIKSSFNSKVFDSLLNFSEIILENKVTLDLDYFNSKSHKKLTQSIKPSTAHIIHNNIVSSTIERNDSIKLRGRFTMLNTKTGYFVFKSNEKMQISGYVSELIKENMNSFNFKNKYDIVIRQNTITRLKSNNLKIVNTLESCFVAD
ncbi:hypothetical protein SGQ83_21680 [Flavobacterium sp. Fl-318]|uniref:Uncharacterized protein n=1 Tax=Flavobacterium cupriresistens TaxID=2893885 RepID=A0ABU4RKT0_9FLAO|nr:MULTISPECIES: hypothetical protein [unclassified Flavobacterium]MDX6191970.1 hypothetical protein [Flavobacterium sp. Fl-318]UFH44609.1 hypothetical protein LNP23_10480 [Flavobacterium sp. F-323]